MSRDPKWAVLWRCWKKPFSGAAANSVQVQIIYLDRGWAERETLMSDQVGTKRRQSLFIRHIAALFAEAHTKCTVSHFEPLLFASWYSPVSEFKMAALCTSVGYFFLLWFCKPTPTPLHCWRFLWMCLLVVPGRTAGLRRNANALLLIRLSGSGELMHGMRPHRGDSMVGLLCTTTQAAFGCTAPAHHTLFVATSCHSRCFQLFFVAVSLPAVPRTSCRHGALWQPTHWPHWSELAASTSIMHIHVSSAPLPCTEDLSRCCVISSADLSRWIKCSPTGLKSQIWIRTSHVHCALVT